MICVSTAPGVPRSGLDTSTESSENTLITCPSYPPKVTAVAVERFVPVTVMASLPRTGPDDGLTALMVGFGGSFVSAIFTAA